MPRRMRLVWERAIGDNLNNVDKCGIEGSQLFAYVREHVGLH